MTIKGTFIYEWTIQSKRVCTIFDLQVIKVFSMLKNELLVGKIENRSEKTGQRNKWCEPLFNSDLMKR